MKKLIAAIVLFLITLNAFSQNTTTLPTPTTSFSPSFRYYGTVTDSLRQIWMQTPGGGWNRIYTATEARLKFAPISGSTTYVPSSRQILNGYGIQGGHSLATDITLALDTSNIATFLKGPKNLYDVPDKPAARSNLSVYSKSEVDGLITAATPLNQRLYTWTNAAAYSANSITRNSDNVITSASVTWPDGSTGTFTTDVISSGNSINQYHVTYVPTSGPTKTITQPLITRNADDAATAQPNLTIVP